MKKQYNRGKRRAMVYITSELLADFLVNGERHFRIDNGVPLVSKFVGAWFEPNRGIFTVVYESDDFKLIPEGEQYPLLKPIVTRIS